MNTMRGTYQMAMGLFDLIDALGDASEIVMAEVGCYSGESTAMFASRVQKVFAIDPWEPWEGISSSDMDNIKGLFDARLKGFRNVAPYCGRGVDFASDWIDGYLDFVYLDGNHNFETVCAEIKAFMPLLRPSGFIGGHDYVTTSWSQVPKAVSRTLQYDGLRVFQDTSWLLRRSQCSLL